MLAEVGRAERELVWQRSIALPYCNELIAVARETVAAHHAQDRARVIRAVESLEKLVGRNAV